MHGKKIHIVIKESTLRVVAVLLMIVIAVTQVGWVPSAPQTKEPLKAKANYQFDPTGGAIVTGSTPAILGATAAAAEGTNIGSYRGAIALDNFHWGITSTTGGYNAYLDFGGAQLSGANILMIQATLDMDATAPATVVQICDWVSTTGVDNAADAQCTGGGWRTVNVNGTTIAPTTSTSYHWQIYDGYWNTSSTAKISTPLTNFVNGSNSIRIRFYSTTNTTTTVQIDMVRVIAVVNPVYSASGATQITGGAITGDYSQTAIGGSGQTGSDDARFQVPGTAGSISDAYLSYTNVKTYPGANAILVRTEFSCSATGINIRPKIWNFTTASWEDLTTASIACSATDATQQWAIGNITLSDYVSSGEVRVGWRGLANGTQAIRIDLQYIMIGSVDTSGSAEVSMGSTSSGSVTDTRTMDTTGTTAAWAIATQDESNTASNDTYGFDGDNDATVEEAVAANITMPVEPPNGAAITGQYFAGRFRAGATGTVQLGVKDYGAATSVTGGWTAVGATVTSAYTYTDNITVNSIASGGAAGMNTNPEDHTFSNVQTNNIRLRTSIPGATTGNAIAEWDFAMTSIQWTEDASHPAVTYQFSPTAGNLITGAAVARTQATAAATEGVNLGDYRATISDDNLHWMFTSTTGGYNAQLDIEDFQLNGANAILLQTEFDLDATAPSTIIQVCDWVSSTGVDHAADAQCTGGGWRTLNPSNVGISSATPTAYHYTIYNGYWNSTATARINTPLSNFVSGSNTLRVRYYSTTNTTSAVAIDYLRVYAVVHPVYSPTGAVQISGGIIGNDYSLAGANSSGSGQTAVDNARFLVPGTASAISDFYFTFNDVETYTGANTILVRANYNCSNTGITHKPKIWNFNTSAWEDLTTTGIACSTTAATNAWAKNNITMSDYVSGGEVRVGWYGSANSTLNLQIDSIYIMIGSTNTDGASEITYGVNSSGSVVNTRTLDMTGTNSTWNITSVDESNTQAFPFYAFDNDADATVEEATAANFDFPVTVPDDTAVTGVFFASRHMSGTAGTVGIGIEDFGGTTNTVGGWSAVGAGGTNALTFTDAVSVGGIGSGGPIGFSLNPEDHVDTVGNRINMRLRTTTSGATTNNSVAQWDFAMVSIQWVNVAPAASITFTTSHTNFPSLTPGSPVFATTTLSVTTSNASGWDTTLVSDDRATGNTVMDLTTDASVGIPDQTEWIPGAATTTPGNAVRIGSLSSSGQVLAFRVMTASGSPAFRASSWWGTLDTYVDNASTLWAGIASSTASLKRIGNSSISAVSPALSSVVYYLNVPPTQGAGVYTGDLTFSATPNP